MSAVVGDSAERAVVCLKSGMPVALPTETVYGLAAPMSCPDVIERIYSLKQRPENNPLIVHVLDSVQLQRVAYVTPLVLRLVEAFWPGPLTLVLPKRSCVPDIVTAHQDSVAVRSPQNPFFRRVIELIDEPLVAPSANKFQHVSPTTAQHVLEDMGDVLEYILDGGPCNFGVESTILSLLDEGKPTILRFGPIAKEEIERFLGRTVLVASPIKSDAVHLSPGLYKKHYSPRTPLYLVKSLDKYTPKASLKKIFEENSAHVFLFSPERVLKNNEFVLSKQKNLREVAARLFAMLHRLDGMGFASIWIEKAADVEIGRAINDRLTRAAYMDLSNLNDSSCI